MTLALITDLFVLAVIVAAGYGFFRLLRERFERAVREHDDERAP